MSKLIAKEKEIVVPGEELADGMDFLPSYGTYREDNKIIASLMGVLNVDKRTLRVIPLAGKYMPKRNDNVIGKVARNDVSKKHLRGGGA